MCSITVLNADDQRHRKNFFPKWIVRVTVRGARHGCLPRVPEMWLTANGKVQSPTCEGLEVTLHPYLYMVKLHMQIVDVQILHRHRTIHQSIRPLSRRRHVCIRRCHLLPLYV